MLLKEPPHLQPNPWAASPGQLLMNLQCGDSVDVYHPAQTWPRQDFHPCPDVRALKLISGLLGLASWRPQWIPQTGSPTTSPLGVLTHSRMPSLSPGLTLVVIQKISRSTGYGPRLVLALEMHMVLSPSTQCHKQYLF